MIQSLPDQKSLPVIKTLNCPNCNAGLQLHTPSAQTLVCKSCNSYIAVGAEDLQVMGRGTLPANDAPIRLGDRAMLDGVSYFVLGRVVYEGWDDEDKWRWTEWQLGSEDGRLTWLAYDKEDGFVLFKKLRLREPFNPMTDRQIPTGQTEGNKKLMWHVNERYPARIIGAEGELTFRAKAGDKLHMVEGAFGGMQYSMQVTTSELEVYEGKTLSTPQVAGAFGNAAWAKSESARKKRGALIATFGAICLLFAVIAVIASLAVSGTGELIATQTFRINATTPVHQMVVNFDQGNRPALVKLWMKTSMPINSYAEVGVSVIDPDDEEVFLFDKEFWYETGRDEDGPWTESDYFGETSFVPEEAGDYEIEIEMGETTVQDFSVQVGVYKNHILPLYFILYAGLIGVLGIGLVILGGSSMARK